MPIPVDEEFNKLGQVERAQEFLNNIDDCLPEIYSPPDMNTGKTSQVVVPSFSELVDDEIICQYCGQKLTFTLTDGVWKGTCKCDLYEREATILKRYMKAKQTCMEELTLLATDETRKPLVEIVRASFLRVQADVMKKYENTVSDYKKFFDKEGTK